ncbi:MAG: prepilin-type N-terminal cleavage/methylation domain-containing protein [Gemmatimonadetes bacterium]|nr:prepilin-type N-terminal cleavage/methylation domain-containing protein [Gemmatimonadota bacterium]NIO31351.1 prepilin-type N-terminal cleavage/methylation domain-containing protein [Gemmatimonadota bacterium]
MAFSAKPWQPRAGFTLLEIVITLVMVAVVYAIAVPAIGRTRVSASVHNARHALISAISLTRATAIRFGRTALLRLDSDHSRLWVEADTTMAGTGEVVTLGHFNFAEQLNVDLSSNRSSLCFNGRGIGTTSSACAQRGAVIVLTLRGKAETVWVSPTGRVLEFEFQYEEE